MAGSLCDKAGIVSGGVNIDDSGGCSTALDEDWTSSRRTGKRVSVRGPEQPVFLVKNTQVLKPEKVTTVYREKRLKKLIRSEVKRP